MGFQEKKNEVKDFSIKQKKFSKCLSDMKKVLNKNNTEFFLCWGTLLGQKRENQFIAHDHDIDIGILRNNFNHIEIVTKIHPVWTTDWMNEETKAKLLKDGISPPTAGDKEIVCPQCKSLSTKEVSKFGSVACQSFYTCNDCKEPFNYFKCL